MSDKEYKQGDIVTVPYPFSDNFHKSKLRPAIVVSNDASNSIDKDLLICPITTALRLTPYSFPLRDEYLSSPLPERSEARCNKITTIRRHIVINKFSSLRNEYLTELLKTIQSVFDISL